MNQSGPECPNCEESALRLVLQNTMCYPDAQMSLMFYYFFFELIFKVGA